MFTLRKEVKQMDKDLHNSFNLVGTDVDTLVTAINEVLERVERIESGVKTIVKDQHRSTKVEAVTGRTYATLAGRVKAIQDHLGVKFEVTPKQVIPAKIDVVKVKKVSKN